MNKLRKISLSKSENGYMFSIKDLGQPYIDAAPVKKVVVNGPADCAGLCSGDGVFAINSVLVKGKTYVDACSIIKLCRTSNLELTIIQGYFLSNTKSFTHVEQDGNSNIQQESLLQKYSPILIKKKAYTYDTESLKRFSSFRSEDFERSISANEVYTNVNEADINNDGIGDQKGIICSTGIPKISYKKATNIVYKPIVKTDSDLNNVFKSSSESPSSYISSNTVDTVRGKLVYHHAHRNTHGKRASVCKSASESRHNNFAYGIRRVSTPVSHNSSSVSNPNIGHYSQTKMKSSNRPHNTSRNLLISSSPILQLNNAGGFVNAPLSIDEMLDDNQDFNERFNTSSYITKDDDAKRFRSSCELESVNILSTYKLRGLQCSPISYRSYLSKQSLTSLGNATQTQRLIEQTQPNINPKPKIRPHSDLLVAHSDTNFNIYNQESHYYQSDLYYNLFMHDPMPTNEDTEYTQDFRTEKYSKHFRKLKNKFDDNYRYRCKTSDSDEKLKDNDISLKVLPTSALVKWIIREEKGRKSSWKQYMINIDENRLVFCREKSQINLQTASLDDVVISIDLRNATIEEEPERRGRKNTLRLQENKNRECLIVFAMKSLAVNWFRIICERSKPEKDATDSMNSLSKERHSFTAPQLFNEVSNEHQFQMSKNKDHDKTSNPRLSTTHPVSSTLPSKSVILQTMSRVKNLKEKFAQSGPSRDFERQQEEWFNKKSNKLAASNSFIEDIQNDTDGVIVDRIPSVFDGYDANIDGVLPLHKWHRSHFSHLVPLVVELCVSIIETFGMEQVGIYRVSGNKLALDFISAELHKPLMEININTDKWNDIHTISGVLKSFLRNLPDSLFPKDLYSDIIGACRLYEFDRERRLLSLQRFLSIMDIAQDHPEYRFHRETLYYLAVHLSRVANKHSTNKMTAKNLAVIFAPNLMKPSQETNQMLVNDFRYKIQLIETLIKHHKWLFSPTLESACNIPSENSEDDLTINKYASKDRFLDHIENVHISSRDNKDARPLVKRILARAANLTSDSSLHEPYTSDESIRKYSLTLAELSKEVYMFTSVDNEYAEVDIDEECEKRDRTLESSSIEKLRHETKNILIECSKDIDDLNAIHSKCLKDLSHVQQQILKVDKEILKTESFLKRTKDKPIFFKHVDAYNVNLPSDIGPDLMTNESPKALFPSTEV